MLHFDAGVMALVREGGCNLVALLLVVGVVGEAAAKADALDAGERLADLAAHVDALAAQVDGRRLVLAVLVIVVVIAAAVVMAAAVQAGAVRVAVLVLVAVARQAVVAFLFGVGHAEVAALPDPRTADGDGRGVVERAGQGVERTVIVLFVLLALMFLVRGLEAGDVVVV